MRQVVRTSIGGSAVRVTISNVFGSEPLAIGAAHVALREVGSRIGDGAALTFGGQPAVTIEGGSTVMSDPVALEVPALGDLAVDLYLPGDTWGTTSAATIHSTGLTTNYISSSGNHAGAAELPLESTIEQWFFLTRVDVRSATAPGAIVTLGDSITDGTGSTTDTNSRWPDFLARRLAEAYGERAPAVLNVGIAGNRVLSDNPGFEFLRQAGLPVPETDGAAEPERDVRAEGALPSRPRRAAAARRHPRRRAGVDQRHRDGVRGGRADRGGHHRGPPSIDSARARAGPDDLRRHPDPVRGRALLDAGGRGEAAGGEHLDPDERRVRRGVRLRRCRARPGRAQRSSGPTSTPATGCIPNDAGYEAMAGAIDLALFDPEKPGPPVSVAPRTAWGAPDLGGIWDFRTITPLERPPELADRAVLTPEEAAAFAEQAIAGLNADQRPDDAAQDVERAYNDFWWDWGDSLTEDLRTSLIVDPPDGRIPARVVGIDEADQARRAGWHRPIRERVVFYGPARGPEDLGLSERCMLGFNAGPPLLPSAYNNNLQLFQTPDHVVIFSEMVHDARIVPLSEDQPHLPESIRQWMGDSRGHWDGDTLVVESTNFTDKTGSFYTIIDSYGSGETLRLEERFTRVDADTLLYSFTVDDPETFTRPITAEIPMRRSDLPLFEYACHEGNYGMTNLLSGARVQEREAAAAEAGADGR